VLSRDTHSPSIIHYRYKRLHFPKKTAAGLGAIQHSSRGTYLSPSAVRRASLILDPSSYFAYYALQCVCRYTGHLGNCRSCSTDTQAANHHPCIVYRIYIFMAAPDHAYAGPPARSVHMMCKSGVWLDCGQQSGSGFLDLTPSILHGSYF
jgi:hypothetical protein